MLPTPPSRPLVAAVWLLALGLAGCPQVTDPEPDGGVGVTDACNSLEEALAGGECELVPGVGGAEGTVVQAWLGAPEDRDWYSFRMPADANARTLVKITGGYSAPSTAVSFSVNVLREDGTQSLVRAINHPGQGAPRPVEIILPFAEPGARLVLLVSDAGQGATPAFDVRNRYALRVDILQNPDGNEPNDVTPTPIVLAAGANGPSGTAGGFLATADDVDLFAFDVPAGQDIAYVRVSAPALNPPTAYRLAYTLLDPQGTPISEGRVANAFLPVELATARRVRSGRYTLRLQGYRPAGDATPVPGDVRPEAAYAIEVRLLTEADPNEPNDTLETARVRVLSAAPGGAPTTFTGRLGAVADPDWYAVDVPAHAAPTLLSYRWRPGSAGGRFPPLPSFRDRMVRVFTAVSTGATPQDRQQACLADAAVCPRNYGASNDAAGTRALVEGFCRLSDPPRCLQAQRQEVEQLREFTNMEGLIPVPPHGGNLRYYFLVEDEGNDYADDLDSTLEVRWLEDPDDAARFSGGAEMPRSTTLTEAAPSDFPTPPAGATVLQGQLRAGYGRLVHLDPQQGQGVRGFNDYDAVATDEDTFHVALPAPTGTAADHKAWLLEWSVDRHDGGVQHDLALALEFCDGTQTADGGTCQPVRTNSRGGDLVLIDPRRGDINAWHGSQGGRQALYDRVSTSTADTTTARPYGCFCLEPRFLQGGTLKVTVFATDRQGYAPVDYRVRTSYTDYPTSYVGADDATYSCPAVVVGDPDAGTPESGGCFFTRAP